MQDWNGVFQKIFIITNKTNYYSRLFIFTEEDLSCLATWKDGSNRYLVAVLNSTHARTDEARYRCFLYQRQRGGGHGAGHTRGHRGHSDVIFKMAQSEKASCVGLWSVDEGVKTFTLKKCK